MTLRSVSAQQKDLHIPGACFVKVLLSNLPFRMVPCMIQGCALTYRWCTRPRHKKRTIPLDRKMWTGYFRMSPLEGKVSENSEIIQSRWIFLVVIANLLSKK